MTPASPPQSHDSCDPAGGIFGQAESIHPIWYGMSGTCKTRKRQTLRWNYKFDPALLHQYGLYLTAAAYRHM